MMSLAADRLKNAAATKKTCHIMDAFEILKRIEADEKDLLEGNEIKNKTIHLKDLQNQDQNKLYIKL